MLKDISAQKNSARAIIFQKKCIKIITIAVAASLG
jgi:cobalamin biosynthesis protein CbiG